MNKGIALSRIGKIEEGLKCHDKALELDPSLIYALAEKSLLLENLHRYDESLHYVNKAIEHDCYNTSLLIRKCTILIKKIISK